METPGHHGEGHELENPPASLVTGHASIEQCRGGHQGGANATSIPKAGPRPQLHLRVRGRALRALPVGSDNRPSEAGGEALRREREIRRERVRSLAPVMETCDWWPGQGRHTACRESGSRGSELVGRAIHANERAGRALSPSTARLRIRLVRGTLFRPRKGGLHERRGRAGEGGVSSGPTGARSILARSPEMRVGISSPNSPCSCTRSRVRFERVGGSPIA